MKAQWDSGVAWWDGRSVRERRMLAAMGALVLGVVVWLAVVRPLDGWKADQVRARVAAERQLLQVQTAAAQRGARPTEAVDLQALVATTASAAGVQPTLGMSEGGRLGFRLERVTTAQAFGWLAALEAGGARIEELGVVENADGTLGVSGALASGV
ncbi:type II secretion system protein GspM [Brevundimonas guildfordensis]|uniref:Type II secretion system protein M n=1 Tax=Brevundimonas guildfordensis TaxID=2762241 RepID=A0ABR8QYY8_9CAUL|nr:type II secretion system protein GspM [Brevundimonas guildfordensis]MBD7940750.1 type II secretion system protein M [Brevundimonas guildfordensis]